MQFKDGYHCPPYIVLIMLFGPGARLDLWLLSPVPSMSQPWHTLEVRTRNLTIQIQAHTNLGFTG